MPEGLVFRQLFEPQTSTYTYLLGDPGSRAAVLIDPVIDTIERDVRLLEELELSLRYTFETHVHADHVTASGELRARLGSESVVAAEGGPGCGSVHVRDGDQVTFGARTLEVRTTPGHTDGCLSLVLDDQSMVFTGDALLIRGTGRTDFQAGDPAELYRSIHAKIFSLPDECQVFPGHDYKGMTSSTVGEEKKHNPRIGKGKSEAEFVKIMNNLKLAKPKRIAVAVPANLACGLPAVEVPQVEADFVRENLGGFWVVDVREPREHATGSIEDAKLVSMGALAKAADAWDRTQPMVMVCEVGARSSRAALQLQEMGFSRVSSLRGGLVKWRECGFPIRPADGSA